MTVVSGIAEEVAHVALGDARLNRRAARIAEVLAASPGDSFPTQAVDDAELEALYRFLNNDRVHADLLLDPHMQLTAARAIAAEDVLVIHDTTVFSFPGESKRRGLGRVKKGGQGFSAHVGLVVDREDGVPLGVIGVVPVVRDNPLLPRKQTRQKVYDRPREFARWEELLEHCFERLADCRAVHVMDREGDAYTLFSMLDASKHRFVIRCKNDRVLDGSAADQPRSVYEALTHARHVLTREVQLSRKRPDRLAKLRRTPARNGRVATLEVTATSVELRHPTYTAGKSRKGSALPRSVPVNVVRVREIDPPSDQDAVEWILYTTLPVSTAEQVADIVDVYRRRWLIEEYFKALKTGCAFEKRQLESMHALLNALALFVPIAWRLLSLRHLSQTEPELPARCILNARQLTILRARAKVKLSSRPTIREAMLAIAAEGGHIKNNGDPGWQVLGRGYEKLLHMEAGFVLGQASK
jgi:Transposase DNA-binding/Transposase DDE domain